MANTTISLKTMAIKCVKTSGAFDSPKAIARKLNRAIWQTKFMFSLSAPSSATCQYPECRSRVEKQVALPSNANISSISGKGTVNGFVIAFRSHHISFRLSLSRKRSRSLDHPCFQHVPYSFFHQNSYGLESNKVSV